MTCPIIYVGIDPGVTGAVTYIRENDPTLIIPYKDLRDISGAKKMIGVFFPGVCFRVLLEKVGSHGQEGRATLSTFMVNYGEWRGLLTGFQSHLFTWREIIPQVWQKPYRERLPVNPKMPRGDGTTQWSKTHYSELKTWRRELGKIQTQRKIELHRIAAELGAPLKQLTRDTADSYLLAIHARDYIEWRSEG